MKTEKILLSFLLISLFCLTESCKPVSETRGLAESYEDYFPIGAAVSLKHLEDYDTLLLKQHFSSITAENAMKPHRSINAQGEYTFADGDRIADFATDHDMLLRGHTLVWHFQTDDWFFRDSDWKLLEKDAMLERMKAYINEVMGHYQGRVYSWDVVNEAISDGEQFYREDSDWYRTCGTEYIEKAFIYAREADPKAKLFYNDYNLINPDKARKVYALVKDFQERGIPIDGIGMQGHWNLEHELAEDLEQAKQYLANAIALFGSLGLEVHITELDLSIYPHYHNVPKEERPTEIRKFTPELEQEQAEVLSALFEVLREKSDIITSVTTWGVADNRTWLSFFIVEGRTDYPLLFDTTYRPKAAVEALMNF